MSVISHDIVLNDKVSGPAKSAAAAVSSVSGEMTTLSKALTAAQSQMTKAAALGDIGGYRKAKANVTSLTAALGPLKATHEAETAAIKSQAAAHQTLQSAYDKAKAMWSDKQKSAADAAAATQKSTALQQAAVQEDLAAVTGGLSLVAEAALAVVGVFAALTIAGAKFAIEASTAKMQMLAMFDALGEGKISGEAVDDMLDGLRDKLGQTKDSMVPLVKTWMGMGITSQDALEKMTTAALSAKALTGGGEAGAAAFEKFAKKIQAAAQTGQGLKIPLKGLGSLADMGLTVDDVAKKMGVSAKALAAELKAGTANATKFGDAMQDALIEKGAGPLKTMGLSMSNLGGLLKEYVGDLFEDMGQDIKPSLAAVKDLFGIIDSKANPSGKALKAGIEGFFKQVFQYATKVVPMVKHFLLDVIIYGLRAYIALKPIVAWFQQMSQNATVISIVTAVFKSLAVVAIVVGAGLALIVGLILVVTAALLGIQIAIVAAVGFFLNFVSETTQALGGWVSGANQAANDFVTGLINGIKNGTGLVIDAVKGLGGSALGALKGVLGIASPSKAGHQIGMFTGQGVAGGLDESANMVGSSAANMGGEMMSGVAQAPAAPQASAAAPASGGGNQAIFQPGSIVIDGAGKSAAEITEEMIAAVWERMGLGAGT